MGRKSLAKELGIWVNGLHAGSWNIPLRGESEIQYSQDWTNSTQGRPLSLSLPFNLDNAPIRGQEVESYFDNLLPESGPIRDRIRSRFGTASTRPFDLLAAIGRDCVGAIQLMPPGEKPRGIHSIEVVPLTRLEVESALLDTLSPAPIRGVSTSDFRISLAGTQEKTAFAYHEGKWCKPLGATPTTHIFKLPLGLVGGLQADMRESIENEWLCSRILRAYGIPVAESRIDVFGNTRVLIVERFDRQLHSSGKYWLRNVQEDFCQATGTPSSHKYEPEGGPGVQEIANILRGSQNRSVDIENFFKAQILFWMLAAGDGHAKNFSIQIMPGGRYRMTPLYDVISYYPIIGTGPNQLSMHEVKLAMAMRGKNKHYLIRGIQRRHINETARTSGVGENAESLIRAILDRTPEALSTVENEIPKGFPIPLAEVILEGIDDAASRLSAMPP